MTKRNLLFHVYPRRDNGCWEWNVGQLLRTWNLFTGVKSIAVVQDETTDSVDCVKEMFHGRGVDNWIEEINDPDLREVVTWDKLWSTVDSGYTFYAHAKGVQRPPSPDAPVTRWTKLLYAANLDYWPEVERLLQQYPIVGCCKRFGEIYFSGKSRSTWHYSGSFFWLQSPLEAKTVPIEQFTHGVESWPGLAYTLRESGVLIGATVGELADYYKPASVAALEREYVRWKIRLGI